jgi:hypothetical protein
MLLDTFWVVVNPTQHSTLQDICFETTPVKYFQYCLGGTSGENPNRVATIEQENHKVHSSERTAKCDAEGRLRIRDAIVKSLADHNARLRQGDVR